MLCDHIICCALNGANPFAAHILTHCRTIKKNKLDGIQPEGALGMAGPLSHIRVLDLSRVLVGPRALQPAYDFLTQAMCGLMSVTGVRDDQPSAGPMKVGIPIVDLVTGIYATTAVVAALAARVVTGKGKYIDMAMFDVGVSLLSNQAMNLLLTGKAPRRTGNAHPNIQPQKVYSCRGGDIILIVGNDQQFASLCKVPEMPYLSSDERFRTNGARVRNQEVPQSILEHSLLTRNRSECLVGLIEAGVPAGPINTIPKALNDPQVRQREMVRNYEFLAAGSVPLVVSPFRFGESDGNASRPLPELSQHTGEVLAEFGTGNSEVAQLRECGVV